jgi:type IV pilus assembly protein PilE
MKGTRQHRERGFTLIEAMIVVAMVAILMSVALPSYDSHIRRSSRGAAQAQLLELAAIQERIFLNSNAYASSVSDAYTGNATGGLGATGAKSQDGRYTLSVTVSGASYTLTATPVAGTSQAADGTLTIDSTGQRTWGNRSW